MSCDPTLVNLEIHKGATYGPLIIRLKDSQNLPVDLTGWSVWAEVRSDSAAAVALDLAPTISDALTGEVTISKTDEQTAALTAGTYLWDLLAENDSGERLGPIVSGSVTIKNLITQPVVV